ncbi:MAG: galactokinase [Chthoniobacterales bacterium]
MASVISAYAPGRVELLGNHTDYNNGVVLAAAIDRGLTVAGSSREDDIISLTSRERVEVRLADLQPQKEQRWANYSLGVVQQFLQRGHPIRGFDAEISGNLPAGVGLSSSAALEVATAGFLMKLFELKVTPLEVANLCQSAENEFVGVQCGLLDQVTSIFGRANQLVYLDCQSKEIRTIPIPPDLALIIADSGVKRSLDDGEYNKRREECAAAARALGVASLREITVQQLQGLDPLLHRRALHIVGENDRVWRAVEALQRDDAATVGELMNASHESSRVNFENSTPELDQLVTIAQSLPGVLGARLTGAGFGGAIVALVRRESADTAASSLRRHANVFVCRIADGAALDWTTSRRSRC